MTVHLSPLKVSQAPVILFGRDWPYFDQRKWPITVLSNLRGSVHVGNRDWVFHGNLDGKELRLFFAASVSIKRHTKIKGSANPYDPEWEIYFEERLAAKMTRDMTDSTQFLHLWLAQEGFCPVCNQLITRKTEWHNHHVIWRSKDGPDTANNRILLHPDCHRKVHSHHLRVEKPRPARGVSAA